eukprot:scaffold86904_cov63-Phaeocystis_antarctica.AAC.6
MGAIRSGRVSAPKLGGSAGCEGRANERRGINTPNEGRGLACRREPLLQRRASPLAHRRRRAARYCAAHYRAACALSSDA